MCLQACADTYIAQVHCVFKAITRKGYTLPHYLKDSPLLYIQYFQITAMPTEGASAGMYRMKHIYHQGRNRSDLLTWQHRSTASGNSHIT
jgi:hypothetical protein